MFSSFRRRRAATGLRTPSCKWSAPALHTFTALISSTSFIFAPTVAAVTPAEARRRSQAAAWRAEAWSHFTNASRQLFKAVHNDKTQAATRATSSRAPSTDCNVLKCGVGAMREHEGEEDEALAALAPAIVRRTSTAAASEALMRELGVVERAEYRPPIVTSSTTATNNETAGRPSVIHTASQSLLAPYLTRVCQTGVQAQVSSFVILKHLWSPFQATSAQGKEGGTDNADLVTGMAAEVNATTPTLQWSARLPSAVRLQLLSHEVARMARRRFLIEEQLQGGHAASSSTVIPTSDGAAAASEIAAGTTRTSLSLTWQQSVLEARAVLCCCAAPWLLGDETNSYTAVKQKKQEGSTGSTPPPPVSAAVGPLLAASERGVLLASLQLATACQAEGVGQQLMQVFVRSVDVVLRRSDDLVPRTGKADGGESRGDNNSNEDEEKPEPSLEAFKSWYEAEGVQIYEAAMACIAQVRCHVSLDSTTSFLSLTNDCDSSQQFSTTHQGDGFARAYSYMVHRGTTTAQLSYQRDCVCGSNSIDEASSPAHRFSGSAWSAFITEHPSATMKLLKPLADCVDTNADHFHTALQLYLRLLEETEVAHTGEEGAKLVRETLVALLHALARVSLAAKSKMTFLEDLHRRTLLNASLEVVQAPEVLAGCLRVCGAVGATSRSTSLFNKLAEPASRGVALREKNLAAVCLSESSSNPPAVLQRTLSFLQTKLPLTANIVHAAVAAALLSHNFSTRSAFATLDLLTGDVAKNRVTRRTTALNAERTFFLRNVILLAGTYVEREQQKQQQKDATASESGIPASLRTPVAAAIFQEWVSALATSLGISSGDVMTNPRTLAETAQSLSYVTVGVLQELCIVLQRAETAVDSANDNSSDRSINGNPSSSSLQEKLPCPLVRQVRRLLDAIPPPVKPSASTRTVTSAAALSGTLASLPPVFQWARLREEWPLSERRATVEALAHLFFSTTAPSCAPTDDRSTSGVDKDSEAVLCLRYQDYKLLEEFCLCTTTEAERANVACVWQSPSNLKQPQQKADNAAAVEPLSPFYDLMKRSAKGAVAARQVHVLSALAEVDWWVHHEKLALVTAEVSPSAMICSLTQILQVSVPPVVGAPRHTWSTSTQNNRNNHKSHTSVVSSEGVQAMRISVTAYWLKRWVDSVEDALVLPTHSLFRDAVNAGIESNAFSPMVTSETRGEGGEAVTVDNTSGDAVAAAVAEVHGDTDTRRGSATAAKTGEVEKAKARQDGMEEMFVSGPASLIYGTAGVELQVEGAFL